MILWLIASVTPDLFYCRCMWTNIAVQCKYLPNVEVRVGKPADDSEVKCSEALWFANLHLTSVQTNAGYRI